MPGSDKERREITATMIKVHEGGEEPAPEAIRPQPLTGEAANQIAKERTEVHQGGPQDADVQPVQ